MKNDSKYGQMTSNASLTKAYEALIKNGMHPYIVENKEEALDKIMNLIPHHDEVMNMTSVTLSEIGIDKVINETTDFVSVRNLIAKNKKGEIEKKRLGTAHEWSIGSVHALTEEGQLIIASATGSQLPSYAYGANNVIWVIGTQKIVKNLEEGFKRIKEYVFPLEDARAKLAYGVGSGINKLLIVQKEVTPGRIHIILVKEKLGF